jgi:hypothetical protein
MNFSTTAINFASAGDNTLVTGISGKIISVFKIFFVVSLPTNLIFKDGTGGTALTGAIPVPANGSLTFTFDTTPWFTASFGNNFVLNQSSTAQISGTVYYFQR